MKRLEKLIFIGCPWFFSIVLIVLGLIVQVNVPEQLHGLLLICTGLICMSLYCVCSILSRIAEKKAN
jgi:galactitol-specific phosphotransferase system IIC component